MRRGFLKPLKPGQGAPLQAFWAEVPEPGPARGPHSPAAECALPLAPFYRIPPRGAAT